MAMYYVKLGFRTEGSCKHGSSKWRLLHDENRCQLNKNRLLYPTFSKEATCEHSDKMNFKDVCKHCNTFPCFTKI